MKSNQQRKHFGSIQSEESDILEVKKKEHSF